MSCSLKGRSPGGKRNRGNTVRGGACFWEEWLTSPSALHAQRHEWLKDELRARTHEAIEIALNQYGGSWLDPGGLRSIRQVSFDYASGRDSYIRQRISFGLMHEQEVKVPTT